MKKRCGNCQNFMRLKDWPGEGLCEAEDGRSPIDGGKSCKTWTGIKYIRTKKYKENYYEIQD